MFFIIILGFAAVAMAHKGNPATSNSQSLGPNENLPSLGATDKFSPAISGGAPLVAKDNGLRLNMVYKHTDTQRDRVQLRQPMRGTVTGIMGGLTDAQSSLKTQDVPPLTMVMPDYTAKSNFLQRIKL
jgi:hypothetical protein